MEWQPIETAPKDGTPILIWFRSWHEGEWRLIEAKWRNDPSPEYNGEGAWETRWAEIDSFGADHFNPCDSDERAAITHWMPLPPPPTSPAA